MFRDGAPLVRLRRFSPLLGPSFMYAACSCWQVGTLPIAGIGKAGKVSVAELSIDELNDQRDNNNSSLLGRLREDVHSAQLLQVVPGSLHFAVDRCALFFLGMP